MSHPSLHTQPHHPFTEGETNETLKNVKTNPFPRNPHADKLVQRLFAFLPPNRHSRRLSP